MPTANTPSPLIFKDEDGAVDHIVQTIGADIRVGVPLGLGKPVPLLNALYRRVERDPSLSLRIFTALTLSPPVGKSFLEKRFLEPFTERVYGGCPEIVYETARRERRLPPNIHVHEFYFVPGSHVGDREAQQDYHSSNYTHVARDVFDAGVNVVLQMVSPSAKGSHLSLSCNPDVSLDLVQRLRQAGRPSVVLAQINPQLPYLYGEAEVKREFFDGVLDGDHRLFSTPKSPVDEVDYRIGLFASGLIQDGGALQVGIGTLGDALVHALCLRHRENAVYRGILTDLGMSRFALVDSVGDLGPFAQGLFGITEMLVDGFMHLYDAGILRKRVFDEERIQYGLNEGKIGEEVNAEMLDWLLDGERVLTAARVERLVHFGVLHPEVQWENGFLCCGGDRVDANLTDQDNFAQVCRSFLGTRLKNGSVVHGGFFVGPAAFYEWLHQLTPEQRLDIKMRPVSRINDLYHFPGINRLQRHNARFINTCMKMTLSGAAVSDGLENGQVISGVGGQYNFVAMAHELPQGRSILLLRSTSHRDGKLASNIVFNYGHVTIPRHLRDVVITEYGIADLRGKPDDQVAQALIEIADSRFQGELVSQAKAAGKLSKSYAVPPEFRRNTPRSLGSCTPGSAHFPAFPFGSDFTPIEIQLLSALKKLKSWFASLSRKALVLVKALFHRVPAHHGPALARMALDRPRSWRERVYRKLLSLALSE